MLNPFNYTHPVPPADIVGRDRETAELVTAALEGTNTRLVAPRRYGKTSLLGRVAAEMPGDWIAVFVDFFGVLTVDDIAERIERAYAAQLTGRIASWFTGIRRQLRPTLRAGGGPVPASVEVDLHPPTSSLLDRLALPRRLHEKHGKRVLVVFDEFQDVLAAEQTIDATIRSEIQHHGEAASYVFAGSHLGMMSRLFADRRRAFYGGARPVELGPLDDEDLAEFIAIRFAASGRDVGAALDPLLSVCRGHPQRSMLAAHTLWDLTPEGGTADEDTWSRAFEQILAETGDELRAIWAGLSTGQRRALTTIARGEPLYGSRRGTGGSRGGATKAAVDALVDRGEVTRRDGGYGIVDPLVAEWLRVER